FYGQILSDTWITHDTYNPGVDVALELPDQCLESIDLAKRKSLEQIHKLLYFLLRGRSEWVTSLFKVRPNVRGETTISQKRDGRGLPCSVAPFSEQFFLASCSSSRRISFERWPKSECHKSVILFGSKRGKTNQNQSSRGLRKRLTLHI